MNCWNADIGFFTAGAAEAVTVVVAAPAEAVTVVVAAPAAVETAGSVALSEVPGLALFLDFAAFSDSQQHDASIVAIPSWSAFR